MSCPHCECPCVDCGKCGLNAVAPPREEVLALVAAAELTIQHFKRNQASGNFQGDDEHECWTALEAALAATPTQPDVPPPQKYTALCRRARIEELEECYRQIEIIGPLARLWIEERIKKLESVSATPTQPDANPLDVAYNAIWKLWNANGKDEKLGAALKAIRDIPESAATPTLRVQP